MPIYEYKCPACGNEFEELVSIHQEKPLPCPKCQNQDTQRKLSVIGAIQMGAPVSSGGSAPACGSSECASGNCPMKDK